MNKRKDFKKVTFKDTNRLRINDIPPAVNYDLEKPIFSLKHMRYEGTHCISKCPEEKKALIIATLLRLSQKTWQDIKSLPKKQGFEPIPHHRFKVALPAVFTPEVTILVTQYDGDGGRLAGYRENDVYHIVLAGKDLYPH